MISHREITAGLIQVIDAYTLIYSRDVEQHLKTYGSAAAQIVQQSFETIAGQPQHRYMIAVTIKTDNFVLKAQQQLLEQIRDRRVSQRCGVRRFHNSFCSVVKRYAKAGKLLQLVRAP